MAPRHKTNGCRGQRLAMLQPDRDFGTGIRLRTKGYVAPVLMSFGSTIVLTLAIGGLMVGLRAVLRLRRAFVIDLGLTALGGVILLGLHTLSPDMYGFDPYLDLPFDVVKHAIELLVVLMVLVAF